MAISSQRLLSLDAFRGLTIAGMILVNNAGNRKVAFPQLLHARWDGCTLADLVFPFFLFIVGVSMTFSFDRRIEKGAGGIQLFGHVLQRSIVLFLMGLSMYGIPDVRLITPFVLVIVGLYLREMNGTKKNSDAGRLPGMWVIGIALILAGLAFFILDIDHFQSSRLRVPGILQRISVCYLLASVVMLRFRSAGIGITTAVLVIAYALVVSFVEPPQAHVVKVLGTEGRLLDWIDVQVLGDHLYRQRPDPLGILSTFPAIAGTLLGVLTGKWLRSGRDAMSKTVGLFIAGNVCLLVGYSFSGLIPLNKTLWSSTYVMFTTGLALHCLAVFYWLIDVKAWQRWARPLLVFGSNAIVAFVASSLFAKVLLSWHVTSDLSIRDWIYRNVMATWTPPPIASLLYSLSYVTFWCLLLLPLHRRRIMIRI